MIFIFVFGIFGWIGYDLGMFWIIWWFLNYRGILWFIFMLFMVVRSG